MRLSNQQAHAQIRDLYHSEVNRSGVTATIWTDGSGHEDGFAGSSWRVLAPEALVNFKQGVAASTDSGTARGEFEALLGGLRTLTRMMRWVERDVKELRSCRPVIGWHTDREDLALSIWVNPATDASHNGRAANADLWAAFGYYERFLNIFPFWRERNSTDSMKCVDEWASEARTLLKNYYLNKTL